MKRLFLNFILILVLILPGCGGNTRGTGGDRPVRGVVSDINSGVLTNIEVGIDVFDTQGELIDSVSVLTREDGSFESSVPSSNISDIQVRVKSDQVNTITQKVEVPISNNSANVETLVIEVQVNTSNNTAIVENIESIRSNAPTVVPSNTPMPGSDTPVSALEPTLVPTLAPTLIPTQGPVIPTRTPSVPTPTPNIGVNQPAIRPEPTPVPIPTNIPTNIPTIAPTTTSVPVAPNNFETLTIRTSLLGDLKSDRTRDWNGLIIVSAFSSSGSQVNVHRSTNDRIGVTGERYDDQIEFNPVNGRSEVLELKLLRQAKNISFVVDQLEQDDFPPNRVMEVGRWRAFNLSGAQVATGLISSANGSFIRKSRYEFKISSSSLISSIRFDATSYSNPNNFQVTDGNNSDYSLRSITGDFVL